MMNRRDSVENRPSALAPRLKEQVARFVVSRTSIRIKIVRVGAPPPRPADKGIRSSHSTQPISVAMATGQSRKWEKPFPHIWWGVAPGANGYELCVRVYPIG